MTCHALPKSEAIGPRMPPCPPVNWSSEARQASPGAAVRPWGAGVAGRGIAHGGKGRAGFGEAERMEPADGERRGDFERGGTAHARAHRDVAVDGGVKTAEMHAAFAQLREHVLDIIGPRGGGIFPQFAQPENFAAGKRGSDEFDFAVGARSGRDVDVPVHGHRDDNTFMAAGVMSEQFEPAGRLDDVRGGVAEMAFEYGLDLLRSVKAQRALGGTGGAQATLRGWFVKFGVAASRPSAAIFRNCNQRRPAETPLRKKDSGAGCPPGRMRGNQRFQRIFARL